MWKISPTKFSRGSDADCPGLQCFLLFLINIQTLRTVKNQSQVIYDLQISYS